MYTTISKPQEGSSCKYSHAKCFTTTNSTAKLSPGGVNRGEFESVSPMRVSAIFPLCFHSKLFATVLICAKTDGNMQ